jgi:hypothetical protein
MNNLCLCSKSHISGWRQGSSRFCHLCISIFYTNHDSFRCHHQKILRYIHSGMFPQDSYKALPNDKDYEGIHSCPYMCHFPGVFHSLRHIRTHKSPANFGILTSARNKFRGLRIHSHLKEKIFGKSFIRK